MARVTTRSPYNVRCSYSGNSQWSRNVTKDVLSMFLKLDNVGAERMSSGRLFQATGPATQNADCRVVALSWVRPNHHEQRNGEQKGWEQSTLECTSRSDNTVQVRGLPCTPVGRLWTRVVLCVIVAFVVVVIVVTWRCCCCSDYKNDPYSHGDACDTICCRGDLRSSPALEGCYDAKVIIC